MRTNLTKTDIGDIGSVPACTALSEKCLVSVVIPTYRPAEYLRECLLSVKNQTLEKSRYEVLIVVNSREVRNLQIARDIASELNICASVKYVNEAGVSLARNIGIECAKGKYLTFVDDDDIVSPVFFEAVAVRGRDCDIIVTNLLCFKDDIRSCWLDYVGREFILRINSQDRGVFALRRFFSNACGKFIAREVIGRCRFDKALGRGEDGLFMAKLAPRIRSIGFSSKTETYYRRVRNNSVSKVKRPLLNTFWCSVNTLSRYFVVHVKAGFFIWFRFYLFRYGAVLKNLLHNIIKR